MVKIEKIYPKGFGANSYLLTADGKNAVVIDPSGAHVKNALLARELTPAYVLLTHCHFDHVLGVASLASMGAKVVCLEQEKSLVGTAADLFEAFGAPRVHYAVDETVTNGQTFTLCGITLTAFSTPGHTAGSAVYRLEDGEQKVLFTGDTLFEGSMGRTDFPTGSAAQMANSLAFLRSLEGDYHILSGHGEDTTLDTERKYNPFLV